MAASRLTKGGVLVQLPARKGMIDAGCRESCGGRHVHDSIALVVLEAETIGKLPLRDPKTDTLGNSASVPSWNPRTVGRLTCPPNFGLDWSF